MRGKPRSWRILPRVFGITPAGAGKTKSSSVKLFAHRDHPRRCGENSPYSLDRTAISGSPPQVRGKLLAAIAVSVLGRITPAGAGKTHRPDRIKLIKEDHPRRCGENRVLSMRICRQKGSPPRMRGKRPGAHPGRSDSRITPADAGKTGCTARMDYACTDHPRGCGENCLRKRAYS